MFALPDRDGMSLLQFVRQQSLTPVIVLSARTNEIDKVAALDAGANDDITKPFGAGELLARVRAALRNNRFSAPETAVSITAALKGNADIAVGSLPE